MMRGCGSGALPEETRQDDFSVGKERIVRMERLNVLIALVSLGIGPCVLAAEPSPDAMNELATAKGCHLCHRAEPGKPEPKAMLPYAPSWKDIVLRYKGEKGQSNS